MKRWFVLLGCFIGMSVSTPAMVMLPLGLYLKSMTTEFGWSRIEFSVIVATASLCTAIILPVAGYLVDRFGARRIIAIGVVLGCSSCAALSLANSYGGFIAILALAVMTGNLAAYPAFMGLAQRWFDKRLGLALAITSTGLAAGAGGFSFVIANVIELQGWRMAFLTVGIIGLIIGIANLIFLVRDNTGPIPAEEHRDRAVHVDHGSVTLGEAMRVRDFWLYSASFMLVIFALVGCNFHLPAMLSDRGASTNLIASIVAMVSAGSLFGRLFTGILLDRFAVLIVAGLFLLGQAVGFLLLLDGLQWALPAGFLLGAVQGAEIDVMGYVIARRFGRLAYSRIFGTCFSITMVGAMTGPVAMATVFDRTGSYDLGLLVLPLIPVLAFILLYLTRYSSQEIEAIDSPGSP